MSRKHKHKKFRGNTDEQNGQAAVLSSLPPAASGQGVQPSGGQSAAHPCNPPTSEAAEVERLIQAGEYRAAVEAAKQAHKRQNTAQSESLLVDAYEARIKSMIERKLWVEAEELLQIVGKRYSSAKPLLQRLKALLTVRSGKLDHLLPLLNDPKATAEDRAAIERSIKQTVWDLQAIAGFKRFPPEHPLRLGAAAAIQAFNAVTSRPVTVEEIALPMISRRSPLAPWKLLVRAIAFFYRHEDDACRQALEDIEPDSVPARLVPVLQAMLQGRLETGLGTKESLLWAQVGSGLPAARTALESLDKAFSGQNQHFALKEIRKTIGICKQSCPQILERLKQETSIRALLANMPKGRVLEAMGGPPRENAQFHRLFAQTLERVGDKSFLLGACVEWESFRRCAVTEGWLEKNSPETAAIYLHQAHLLSRAESDDLEHARHHYIACPIDDAGAAVPHHLPDKLVLPRQATRDNYFLFPACLYECACTLDPHPEAFQAWLELERKAQDPKAADHAAEAWHRVFPKDSRPLLFLMQSAEARNAFQKALGFLEEAELQDGLNPEVRRARLRLLVATAILHLKKKKIRLAEQDLEKIALLPQAQEGDRPAFLAALRWACATLQGEDARTQLYQAEVSRLLESDLAAHLLLSGLTHASEMKPLPRIILNKQSGAGTYLAAVVSRACALGDDMQVPVMVPEEWGTKLLQEIASQGHLLELPLLRALAEAALRIDDQKLAYAATAAGLTRKGPSEARFLLLRAQALPVWESRRRDSCIAATIALAGQQRDLLLVEEASALRDQFQKSRSSFGPFDPFGLSEPVMKPELLGALLKSEREAKEFPKTRRPAFDDEFEEECQCPRCRERRREEQAVFQDSEDESDEEPGYDFDGEFDPITGFEDVRKMLGLPKGVSPNSPAFKRALDEMAAMLGDLDALFPLRPRSKNKSRTPKDKPSAPSSKKRKLPSFGQQGSLF